MLIFIGMGLWDERDISCKGLEVAKKADEVCIEFYTSKLMGTDLKRIERFIGRRIRVLERGDLEERCDRIIETARNRDVVILTAGDPMIATTHSALRLEAEKKGVRTTIIHSASIISAVCGLTGLHNYKFGKSATISWIPSRTPLDVINQNLSINAHTLLYLDLHPRPMLIRDGIEILMKIDRRIGDLFGVGIARAGSTNPDVKCDRLKKLIDYDFGDPLHVLVVLSKKLHFMEFECLKVFADAPDELEELVE